MKLFVSPKRPEDNHELGYYKSNEEYCYTDENEILMFGLFQKNDNPLESEISMCGIKNRRFTTLITVKKINIPYDFLYELLKESIEKHFNTKVYLNGDFFVKVFGDFQFNLHDLAIELIAKARNFEEGENLKCKGREIFKLCNQEN